MECLLERCSKRGGIKLESDLLYKKGTRVVFHVPLSPKLGRFARLLSDSPYELFDIAA